MKQVIILLTLLAALITACTPSDPLYCSGNPDCQAHFDTCSCSWTCTNDPSSFPLCEIDCQDIPPEPNCACLTLENPDDPIRPIKQCTVI